MADGGAVHIGEVAERTSLSLRTLRHYDEIGLVTPSSRTEGGFRLYTEPDVARLMLVRRMKPLGYSLDQMREVLDLLDASRDAPGAVRARLAEVEAEALQRRERLVEQVRMADEFLEQLQGLKHRALEQSREEEASWRSHPTASSI